MSDSVLTFDHAALGITAALLLLTTLALGATRRPAVPRATLVLAAVGSLLLALAAGGLAIRRAAVGPVAVMVDLSASTRGAAYRDDAALRQRLRELLGDIPYEIHRFGEGPASRTLLPPLDAPALVLLSDGRFTADGAWRPPPTFCVIDPALDDARDAAVTSLGVRGDSVAVGVRLLGGDIANATRPTQPLALQGVAVEPLVVVPPGSFILTGKLAPGASIVSATFAPGDAWPENDSLSAVPPPPALAERWWVGTGKPAGDAWRVRAPAELPADPSQYLGASVVVLENVSADSLDDARRAALQRYVRDLGGGLLILGGERAFAAGGYAGTGLDDLSPLASTPPEPTTRWIVLADASGSMNQPGGGGAESRTRWQYAAEAAGALVRQLPPADVLDIGSFAAEVRWWSRGKSAREALALPLPPADVRPTGPTNLDAALRQIAAGLDAALPGHVLLATDAQASIDRPAELAAQFKARQTKVHVLLIGDDAEDAPGLAALKLVVNETGGTFRAERLPQNWAAGLRELFRAAQPPHIQREPVTVRFLGPLAALGSRDVPLWNQTWLKARATMLADAQRAENRMTMAARWNFGEGRVAAAAFPAGADVAEALARVVERPPRDPRFKVSWEVQSTLRVAVDAVAENAYINSEKLTLEVLDRETASDRLTLPIPQTAPGRYELSIDAPPGGGFARVRRGEQVLDTVGLPRRYPPEFDEIGTDRAALANLARRTGGAVVEPGVTRRLDVPWPRRSTSLVSFLATAGAALVAAGLVRWRIGS